MPESLVDLTFFNSEHIFFQVYAILQKIEIVDSVSHRGWEK